MVQLLISRGAEVNVKDEVSRLNPVFCYNTENDVYSSNYWCFSKFICVCVHVHVRVCVCVCVIENAKKKCSVFLSVIGPSSYKLLRNLITPAKLGEKTLGELFRAMTQHHSPTPFEIVQIYKFHSRFRKPEESVATFVSELHSLA